MHDRLILRLCFVSGMTALVLQVLWLRGFALALGGTVHAMSCVVTAFLVGLGAGSFAAERLLPRWQRVPPLVVYGAVELVAGVTGALLALWLFGRADAAILAVTALERWALVPTPLAHFGFVLALVLVPTFFLGMSFPAAARVLSRAELLPRLYGINTVGAGVGSLVATFALIAWLGCFAAAGFVAVVNALVFFAAWRGGAGLAREETLAAPTSAPRGLGVLLATLSGFAVFAAEIAWHRHLSLFLGNRVYVASITLFVVLYLLGLGARLCHRWAPRRGALRLVTFGASVGVLSLSVGLACAEPAFRSIFAGGAAPLWGKLAAGAFLLFAVAIPAVAMGLTFPAAIAIEGRRVGTLYGVNTAAGVVGSLGAAYWGLSAVGSGGVLAASGVALLAIGGAALLALRRDEGRFPTRAAALFGVAAVACVALLVPAARRPLRLLPEALIVASAEDEHGLFTVAKTADGRLRVLNDTTQLVFLYGDPSTQRVQEAQAYAPLLFSRGEDNLLNIGAGYGITAGAMAKVATVKHVDAIEIVPLLVTEAERFAEGNFGYHRNPKVTVTVADGRHFLAAGRTSYDVISVNVTDPYLPGSASLFTDEFYRLAKRRLAPGGVFCQHLFGPDLVSLYHGAARHFAHVRVMRTYANGINFLGSDAPLGTAAARDIPGREELLRQIAEGDELAAALRAETPRFHATDARPSLEFAGLGELGTLLRTNF